MKKFLLILSVALLSQAPVWAYDFSAENDGVTIYYNITSESEVAVTYETSSYNSYSGELTIPETVTYNGYTYSVTSIEKSAFYECTGLTSVIIGDNVTTIGDRAFYECMGLTSVTLGESVTTIGNNAFGQCTKLTSITIPASVTSIAVTAFEGCSSLQEFVVEEGNMYYSTDDYGVLYNKDKTTIVRSPEGSSVKTYTIPETVTTIGARAFSYCGLNSLTIGSNVTTIEEHAFYNSYLTEITIPDNVTSIGEYAFGYCQKLTTITIGSGVTNIGRYAFESCIKLSTITILCETPPTCGSNIFLAVTTSNITLYVPKGTKSAYSSAGTWGDFVNIEEMAAVGDRIFVDGIYYGVQNNNVVYVTSGTYGRSATAEYTGEMTIPETIVYGGETYTVTAIGGYAFVYSELTGITIPNSVTTIDTSAFEYCTALERVTLGSGVTSIGSYAFEFCSALKEITIPDNVVTIGHTAFANCYALESVTLGSGLKTIDHYAFLECSALKEITIPDNVETIGYEAFGDCPRLESATIGSGVKEIGVGVFEMAFSLTKLEVSEDNEYYCSVDNVLYTKDMTTLMAYAGGLEAETFEIPESVTTIEAWAFSGATHLTSINITDNVTEIGFEAFAFCFGLQSVTIGNGMETLGEEAFALCYALESVVLGSNVTEIVDFAFGDCFALQSVTSLNPEPPMCGSEAFYEVDIASVTLYVPAGSKEAYSTAEVWKDFGTIEEIVEPILAIDDAADITTDSATLTGTITKGTFDILACGFEYWVEDGDVETLECEGDELTATLIELADDTTYAFRAYATTVIATYYSETLYFTTEAETTGIEEILSNDAEVEAIYDLNGIRVSSPVKGNVYIILYSDGTVQKVLVK